MLSLFKALVFLTALDVSAWQNTLYSQLVARVTNPSFPQTFLQPIDDSSLNFISYSGAADPGAKYYYVLHDVNSAPTWLFLIRHDNKIKDELWHRGTHFNVPCNVMRNDKLLLHIKTVGFIKTDIVFQVKYEVQNTKYGVVLSAVMDHSFPSSKVLDFKLLLWVFPHPTLKNLVIIVSQGYIKTSYSIDMLDNQIKWHIDNIMQNVGDRLIAVTK